jgi:hypothetical protein
VGVDEDIGGGGYAVCGIPLCGPWPMVDAEETLITAPEWAR